MQTSQKITRAEQKARRPSQILDAAFEEFVKCGYSATRIDDIADRIGVTKGTIYVYFDTKENLFSAMIRHISTPFEEILSNGASLHGNCSDRLRRMITSFYGEMLNNRRTRELLRFVIAEGPRFPDLVDRHHHEFIDPLMAHTQSILDEGVLRGEFRGTPFANIIIGPVLSMVILKLIFDDRRTVNDEAHLAAHLDIIFNGIAK